MERADDVCNMLEGYGASYPFIIFPQSINGERYPIKTGVHELGQGFFIQQAAIREECHVPDAFSFGIADHVHQSWVHGGLSPPTQLDGEDIVSGALVEDFFVQIKVHEPSHGAVVHLCTGAHGALELAAQRGLDIHCLRERGHDVQPREPVPFETVPK